MKLGMMGRLPLLLIAFALLRPPGAPCVEGCSPDPEKRTRSPTGDEINWDEEEVERETVEEKRKRCGDLDLGWDALAERQEDPCKKPCFTGFLTAIGHIWYHNIDAGDCVPFTTMSVGTNRFASKQECRDACL